MFVKERYEVLRKDEILSVESNMAAEEKADKIFDQVGKQFYTPKGAAIAPAPKRPKKKGK